MGFAALYPSYGATRPRRLARPVAAEAAPTGALRKALTITLATVLDARSLVRTADPTAAPTWSAGIAHPGGDGVDGAQERVEPFFLLRLVGFAAVAGEDGDLDVVEGVQIDVAAGQ